MERRGSENWVYYGQNCFNPTMFKAMILGLVAFLVSQGTCPGQDRRIASRDPQGEIPLLKCDQQKVVYTRFDEAYSKRIVWQSLSSSEHPPVGAMKEYSPQHTKWSVTVEPDRMKLGPWTTTIYFGSDRSEEVWKLTVVDNIQTDFKWLSDKLIFGSVWWGRIYATDLILDLDNHKFIYREMAQYGDMIQPCQ
jgi:hypothetical protein